MAVGRPSFIFRWSPLPLRTTVGSLQTAYALFSEECKAQ
jgi:hypothetical protein